MIRALLLLLILCFALFIASQTGCDSGGVRENPGPVTPATPATEPQPETFEPHLQVKSVRDLGTVDTNSVIAKRDCGYSANYQGRSVWIFGDTFLEINNENNRSMLCNSWSVTYDIDAGDKLHGMSEKVDDVGAPVEFFPLTDAEHLYNEKHKGDNCAEEPCNAHWAIWPGAIVVDEKKDWAYIFYRKVHVERGSFNFYHVGHSMAVWKNYDDPVHRPVFDLVEEYPTLFFSEGENGFGSAAFVERDVLYVYGCELEEGSLAKPCRLARVPIASILERSAWEFYQPQGDWSPDVSSAAVIFNSNEMMTVFYVPYIERYVAVYSEPMTTHVMIRTATSPEGPWSRPGVLFAALEPEDDVGWIYDAMAHPEFSEDDGRVIYVTYSRHIKPNNSEMRLLAIELEPVP